MGELFKYSEHRHRTTVTNWGNTYVFRQCPHRGTPRRYAASNGYVMLIHMSDVKR
jgi:hypothetical protein